ncbi:MAG: hypothetical protein N3F09_07360 [Bacteroidia bacterium]|nr:hypothetical protein [Bacteroidia bacterium]
MKDLIWTIIGIWFAYRIFRFFDRSNKENIEHAKSHRPSQPSEKVNESLSDKGEYIEFEEVKD